MKIQLFSDETVKLWKTMSSERIAEPLHIELEFYQKILNFFQVGDYFYLLFNFNKYDFDMVSPGIKNVLGYGADEFSAPLFMDCIHPDDRPWFLAFETRTAQFLTDVGIGKLMKYKVRYDFRFKKKDGCYIRVLHQAAVVEHDDKGGIIRTLVVLTDITQLKPEGLPVVSYIGMEGEPSYHNIDIQQPVINSKEVLSRREKQILIHLIAGRSSKETAALLNISKQTIDTHRKNMLNKTRLGSTGELIAQAIKQGWI